MNVTRANHKAILSAWMQGIPAAVVAKRLGFEPRTVLRYYFSWSKRMRIDVKPNHLAVLHFDVDPRAYTLASIKPSKLVWEVKTKEIWFVTSAVLNASGLIANRYRQDDCWYIEVMAD